LRGVLDGSGLDFTREPGTEELAGEASLTIVATHNEGVFRAYPAAAPVPRASGVLTVNPLYRVERRHGLSVLTLDFPTPEYEAEFAACKDYLPATVSVPADVTVPFDAAALGEDYEELRRRRVILDLPARYC
jgi:hypothetical protein